MKQSMNGGGGVEGGGVLMDFHISTFSNIK